MPNTQVENKHKNVWLWLSLITIILYTCTTTTQDWQTDYEKSGCLKTPRYAETMAYCNRMEEASPW
ncbi:MAG: hypothetical protein GY850_20230, partial [bacterium]|nr:hypothetical protein [bacterium]